MVGVFNCQGAGWCKEVKKVRIHDTSPETLTTTVRITDIDSIDQVAGPCWKGEAVIYAHRSGKSFKLISQCGYILSNARNYYSNSLFSFMSLHVYRK